MHAAAAAADANSSEGRQHLIMVNGFTADNAFLDSSKSMKFERHHGAWYCCLSLMVVSALMILPSYDAGACAM